MTFDMVIMSQAWPNVGKAFTLGPVDSFTLCYKCDSDVQMLVYVSHRHVFHISSFMFQVSSQRASCIIAQSIGVKLWKKIKEEKKKLGCR